LELEKAPDFAEAGANAARTQPRVVLYHPTAGLRDQSRNLFPIASPAHGYTHKRSAFGEHAAEREGKHFPLPWE